jgi:glutamate racemase
VKEQPIGIFDSGVGGLTVAHAIKQLLPGESLIYFGDTAHLPYGDKSSDSIKYYSKKITEFLLEQNAKVILVACNSASASAFDTLQKEFMGRTILLDVIDPVVDYYENKVKEKSPGTTTISLATPLLVPMIEEGFIFDDISNAILRTYLSDPSLAGIEALILGCTHYPIIKNQISKIFNFNLEVIDSARIVSVLLKKILEENKIINDTGIVKDQFYVSDYTPYFEKIAKMFFEGDINLKKADIWN